MLLGARDGRGRNALALAQYLLSCSGGGGSGGIGGASGGSGWAGTVLPGVPPGGPALVALGSAAASDLAQVPGIGPAKAARVVAGIELGRRAAVARLAKPAVRSPRDIADLFGERLGRLDREHFYAVLLDTKNQVIAAEHVAVGSLDASLVHPREVFKAAVRQSAAAVVLIHNHPSGDPSPSEADVACTARLQQAGRVLGIAVLDHIVIGSPGYVSFREAGIGGLYPEVE